MRITRHQAFIEVAHVMSKRSTCFRLNVGAVVVVNNRIVATGYNGAPAGQPHCQGQNCPGRFECHETIHAEDNALRHVPDGFKDSAKDLYVTNSPCKHCAELCIDQGVRRLFYTTPYRLADPLVYLINEGVEVYQITPSGYVIRFPSQELVDGL